MRRSLLSALLVLSAAGCFYPAERGKMIEERVSKLEADNKQLEAALQTQKERLEAQIPKLDEQVALVQEALDKLDRASRRSNADVGLQVEQLQGDLAALRGKLEEHVFRLNEVQTALAELRDPAKQPAAGAPGEAAPAEPAKPPEPIERPTDKKAFAELVSAKLTESPAKGRELAGEWLRKWPTDALAARVHYELGVSWFEEKNCRAALAEFGALIKPDAPKSFSKSQWAPEALLKSSECFATLGMKDESRLALEEVVNGYPKSDAAKKAKAKLDEKKKGKGRGK
jgi:TolA-binding protein